MVANKIFNLHIIIYYLKNTFFSHFVLSNGENKKKFVFWAIKKEIKNLVDMLDKTKNLPYIGLWFVFKVNLIYKTKTVEVKKQNVFLFIWQVVNKVRTQKL